MTIGIAMLSLALAATPASTNAQIPSNISVLTFDQSGAGISGYYATFWVNGQQIYSCFSSCSDTVDNGYSYQVAVGDYGSCTFSHWANNGSTNRYYTVDLTNTGMSSLAIKLDAIYNCGSSSSSTSALTINTQDQNGNPINGYYTVLNQSSTIVATGFTPHTFTLNNGATYGVQVDNYGSCHFDYWADTGSTSFSRTVSISSNAAYTAVMNCGTSGGGGGGGTSTLHIFTANSMGAYINGYYVSLWQNGVQINSCFSPCSFIISNNVSYQVAVSDFGSEAFSHWNDGSTNRFHPVTILSSQDLDLAAYYNP